MRAACALEGTLVAGRPIRVALKPFGRAAKRELVCAGVLIHELRSLAALSRFVEMLIHVLVSNLVTLMRLAHDLRSCCSWFVVLQRPRVIVIAVQATHRSAAAAPGERRVGAVTQSVRQIAWLFKFPVFGFL